MVKILSKQDEQVIHAATKKAEGKTTAHIATVILPASDTYSHYIMFSGFIFGSLIDIFLWHQKIQTHFPYLLAIQILCAFLFLIIPGIKVLILKLMPKEIYHHRAALMAAEKRLSVSKHANASTPILLLFISYAEHYIHIYPNAVIREKIPDEKWNVIVQKLARNIPKLKLAKATAEAIEESGVILSEFWR